MKTNKTAALLLAGLVCLASCSKDGDIIYTSGPDDATIEGTSTDIVLDKDNLGALVLTVYWNNNGEISFSDPEVAAPANAATNVLQMASNETFSGAYEETMDGGVYSRQYTCKELNSVLSRIGIEGGTTGTLYIRVKTSIGANLAPRYSNVLSLNVTPYFIDMSVGFVLDASQADTGMILASPDLDGVYTGFIGAGSWYNWWLREGNGITWGNIGIDGKPFVLDSTDSGSEVWNFWYPGMSGCYYTTVNTGAREWTALYIPELNLSGDLSGAMTFDRKANKWTYTFNAEAKTYNIGIAGPAKLYNAATGTDDAAALDKNAAFGGTASNLTFGETGSSIALTVASAGETTITLDLNDPNAWTLTASAGGAGPVVEIPQNLYLSGVYGPWDFNWSVKLYNEDNLTYGAMLPVNSEWGYKIYTEPDNWDDFYSMVDGGTAFEGSLEKGGNNNLLAPPAGNYLFDISIGDMKYKLHAVNSVSYTGLNDDWSLKPMQATDQPCVYTAEVEKSANTPWGVKIVLNDNWDLFFGGKGTPGELYLYRDGFEGDNDLANGTYILTVDLAKGTYSYTAK